MLRQALKNIYCSSPGSSILLMATVAVWLFAFCGTALGADEASEQGDVGAQAFEPGALEFARIYQIWQQEPNLTGRGIQIAAVCPSQTYVNDHPQNDYRFNMNHNSLYDADVQFTDGTDGRLGTSSHATAVAGVLLGLDETARNAAGTSFHYRGVCPDAAVTVHEFWHFVIVQLYGGREPDADLITLSLGEIFETWWTRAIEHLAADKDVLVVASVGNGADVLTPSPLYPGAGSNVLGVGVVDSTIDNEGRTDLHQFSQVRGVHSSMGPTGDLRCKPDLVAPGTALVPVHNNANDYQVVENWSSISAPIVCGTAALLLQKANEDDSLKEAMQGARALVLKSVLMNSARKLPYWHKGQATAGDDHETPLDFLQGAGLIDAAAAENQLTAGAWKPGEVAAAGWDSRVLEKGAWGYEYAFTAAEPNQVITVTLCWNRSYTASYPYSRQTEEDADMRLELWGVQPELSREALLDYSDSVNDNVEHIYFACDPNFVQYAVRVKFNENSTSAARQRFAVAWSVGRDRQSDNPWWYDLNGDSSVDETDKLIYALLDEGVQAADNPELAEPLKLSGGRMELLSSQWNLWKTRLSGYAQGTNETLAAGN